MPTAAELLPVIAPEFAGDQSAAIAVAEMQVGVGFCGDKRPLLVAYLAAHILTLGKRSGGAGRAAGSVTNMTEGKLSIGFGGSGMIGSLGQTSYGTEYDRISRGCTFTARTRVTELPVIDHDVIY